MAPFTAHESGGSFNRLRGGAALQWPCEVVDVTYSDVYNAMGQHEIVGCRQTVDVSLHSSESAYIRGVCETRLFRSSCCNCTVQFSSFRLTDIASNTYFAMSAEK